MPGGLAAMWRALKRGYQAEPWLLSVALGLSLLAALPDALIALWLKLLADGLLSDNQGLLYLAAAGLGLSSAATWFLRVISDRTQRRFRDRVTIALESHVAGLQAAVSTVTHHERPDYLDRLAVLRNQVFVLDHMYMSLFTTCGWLLRLAVTLVLLISVHPALALLALFALPTVVTASWRPGLERATEEKAASHNRQARHLFDLATTAVPGKEVRVSNQEPALLSARRAAWERWYQPLARVRWHSAGWHMLAWAIFAAGFMGALVFVAWGLQASAGAVLLVLAAGARLSAYIGATVGEIGFLRGIWLDGAKRMAWLEDYASAQEQSASAPAPTRLTQGIRIENLWFRYPGTDKPVLADINLTLPAGAVIALVGENGAGKSTLVKLLCKFYLPDAGRILIDEQPLSSIDSRQWRQQLAGAFQDFFRFELPAKHSVGIGELSLAEDTARIQAALHRADAGQLVQQLPSGLDTQLGKTWPAGVDLSFGQWQKLALARGFMRNAPLLLLLDEPTAALDAETEHKLFAQYASAARSENNNGRITLLVSHRFSTVRMADLIVVLDGAHISEVGTHDALMARNGQYAELYRIQAHAYKQKSQNDEGDYTGGTT